MFLEVFVALCDFWGKVVGFFIFLFFFLVVWLCDV